MLIGNRIGPYEVLAKLGEGGMGEVYKARDTRLDRIVALKTLSPAVTADPAFHERFDREARAISQLSHPHICTLHDVGTADGMPYLVLEYLEGETLAARLARGALPLDQALAIGAQMCDALDRAHRHGIVHRDLKPANVMLTKAGAKLLDFGLAKPATPAVAGNAGGAATVSSPLTAEGTLLGTLQYMAPEQVEGKEADPRSDIFACGAVLHEMVSGQRAFEAKTAASLIAAIIERHPPPLSSVQKLTPPLLDHVVARCLAKDPEERWQSARDVMRELEWIRQAPRPNFDGAALPATRRPGWVLAAIGVLLGGVIGAAIVGWLSRPGEASPDALSHFAIAVPQGYSSVGGLGPQLAVARDGSFVVFAATVEASVQLVPVAGAQTDQGGQLFIKRTDAPETEPLPGTDRGHSPFLSPDGAWVGFNRESNLYKIPLKGGPAVLLARAIALSGASWGDDGFIVYSPMHGGGIWRISEKGGEPEQLTRPDPKQGERGHHQPFLLPGGKSFLFTIEMAGRSHDDARIAVYTIATRESRTLLEGGMSARFVPPDRIVYGRAGQLLAVRFDPSRLQVSGAPTAVMSGVRMNPAGGGADFAVANDGGLAYTPGGGAEPRMPLIWVDRNGATQPLSVEQDSYRNPRLSPSMTAIAVQRGGADDDVWIIDLVRNARQRATFAGDNLCPVWFPTGDRLLLNSDEGGAPALYAMSTAGATVKERLIEGGFPVPASLSPDGAVLAYLETAEGAGGDIWTMTLSDRRRTPLVQTRFDEQSPMFSPDGQWLAYVSNESGRQEVIVAHYPDLANKTPVSVDGGSEPVWARNGRELFYRQGDRLMAVPVTLGARLTVGEPRVLFRAAAQSGTFGVSNYDVTTDGKRFLMVGAGAVSHTASHLNYVVGWAQQFRSR